MGFIPILGLTFTLLWLIALAWTWRKDRHLHAQRQAQPHEQPNHATADYHSRDLLAGGAIVLATLAFFWRMVSGDVYQPADGGDLVSFLFPTYRFAADELARGALPLWNPTLYGGAPFISDIQAGFLYPPNLLLFLAEPDFTYVTMQWLVLGHIMWAGLGMYALLRLLRWPTAQISRPAALFGAFAFMFSDPILVHLGNLNLIAVLSWLPWLLGAFHIGLTAHEQGRGRLWLAIAGITFAIANYAGHAQSTLYLALALGLYTLGWTLVAWPEHGWQALWAGAWRLAATGTLALLLSAPILLPAFELTNYTERSAFSYQDTTAFSLAPTQLLGILTPGFFGRGPALHWSLWDRIETPYAGVATALLALGALLMAPAVLRRRLWAWAGLAIAGLLIALGVYALVHGWLTVLIPPFAQMRAPARALILWNTGLAVLAAVGVDLLVRQGQDALATPGGANWRGFMQRGALLWFALILPLGYGALLLTQDNETAFLRASVALLALVFAALWWLTTWLIVAGTRTKWWSGTIAAALLTITLLLDLGAAGAYTDISPIDPTAGFNHPEIVDFLRADQAQNPPFRIDTRTDIQELWQPDTAALYGLEDVGGIVNPLALAQWQAQWAATGGRATAAYDMLNVKYVIVRDGTPLPEGKFELALDAAGPLAIYRNAAFMPRAWVVYAARLATDMTSALEAIQATDFDPATTAILLDNDELQHATPYGPLSESPPAPSSNAVIAIDTINNHTLNIAVDAAAPGFVILSEIWYPGWQATVHDTAQSTRQTVLHANGALRAIPIPAGRSTIELRFRPAGWRMGYALAGVGLVFLAVLILTAQRWRRWQRITHATGRIPARES